MNDEEKRAVANFNAASKAVGAAKPNDNGAENWYASAYKALVRLGLRAPIRKKYRA